MSNTLADFRRAAVAELTPIYGSAEAAALVRVLLEDVLELPGHRLGLAEGQAAFRVHAERLRAAQARLAAREPVQYVTGWASFYGLRLRVDPRVLIPRPETEELVAWGLEQLPPEKPITVADLGTGSGCIALAVAKARPQAQVTGVDLSAGALEVATANAERLGLAEQTAWVEADMQRLPPAFGPFDAIFCNPPYIPQAEAAALAEHVRKHEPSLALFGPGPDGTGLYLHLARHAAGWLKPDGALFLELHAPTAAAVQAVFDAVGWRTELRADLHRRPRMLKTVPNR